MKIKSTDDLKEENVKSLYLSDTLLKKWEIDMSDIEIQKKYFSSIYSTIFIGIQKSTNTVVCVKQFNDIEDESSLQNFQNEFQALSVLDHFAIPQFIGATFSPKISIITQFMSGGSLYSRLHSKYSYTKLQSTQLSVIALGIAYGMTYLHSNNIIHRDLKSLNILLDANSLPTISDFGTSARKNSPRLTGGVGTAQWMAPEVLDSKPYDHKVDVYSYGMILWEMLTGDIPFNGLTQMEVALSVVTQKIRPKIPLNCPKNLARLIRTCWDDDPAKRPEFRRIVDILESCSITFSGTDIKQFQSYIQHFSSNKHISVMEDTIPLVSTKSSPLTSYISSSQNLLTSADAQTIERLVDNLQKSTEPLSKFIQIAENPSLLPNLANNGQIVIHLSNQLKISKYRNNPNEDVKIIHLLSLLLKTEKLRETFLKNNCQNSLLIVLSENTTQLIPELLDCLTIAVQSDSKIKFDSQQLSRISSYLLCADMTVKQTAASLLLSIAEKKCVTTSLDNFLTTVENLLVNLFPELNNSLFLNSIVSLLLILVQHSSKLKNQIIFLYGPEKIIALLTSKSHHVLDLSLDLSMTICSDESVRSRTSQTFVDEFPTILQNAAQKAELLAKLYRLVGLYFKDKATFECISYSDDFISHFIQNCISQESEKANFILAMKLLYILCRVESTSVLLIPFIGEIVKHLSASSVPSVSNYAALSISALLSKSGTPNEVIKGHLDDLQKFANFAFKGQNEVTLSALSLFGVLSNLRDTQYICLSLSVHQSIIQFLKSDNFAIVQTTIRVLISMTSSSFGGELKGLSKAIKPLFLLGCDTKKKFGSEPLVCIANILIFQNHWKSAIPFIEKLFDLYEIPDFCEIALLITYRIVSAAEFSITEESDPEEDDSENLFSNQKILKAFIEKSRKILDNKLLISILLRLAEVKSSCDFLKKEQIVDLIDEIIFQCSIDDVRRPKLLRIHSYLSKS